jgi:hypothetical protein
MLQIVASLMIIIDIQYRPLMSSMAFFLFIFGKSLFFTDTHQNFTAFLVPVISKFMPVMLPKINANAVQL